MIKKAWLGASQKTGVSLLDYGTFLCMARELADSMYPGKLAAIGEEVSHTLIWLGTDTAGNFGAPGEVRHDVQFFETADELAARVSCSAPHGVFGRLVVVDVISPSSGVHVAVVKADHIAGPPACLVNWHGSEQNIEEYAAPPGLFKFVTGVVPDIQWGAGRDEGKLN